MKRRITALTIALAGTMAFTGFVPVVAMADDDIQWSDYGVTKDGKKVNAKEYSISKAPGTYTGKIKVTLKEKKGHTISYIVYNSVKQWKTLKPMPKTHTLKGGKSKTLTFKKTTILELADYKWQMGEPYKYTIKKAKKAQNTVAKTDDTQVTSPVTQ